MYQPRNLNFDRFSFEIETLFNKNLQVYFHSTVYTQCL